MDRLLKYIPATIMILSSVIGVVIYMENNYAKAEDVQRVEQRLDQKILEDRYWQIQSRIWRIEDRLEKSKDPVLKKELRELEEEKEMIKGKLDRIGNE